jgi:hypothetical protein
MLTLQIGCFEASAYPGALMLFMSWYTPREIAFRIGFYHSCQSIGNMVSLIRRDLQYAIADGASWPVLCKRQSIKVLTATVA